MTHLWRTAARLLPALELGERAILLGKQPRSDAQISRESARGLLLDRGLLGFPTEPAQCRRSAPDVPHDIRTTGNAVLVGVVRIRAFPQRLFRNCLEQAEPDQRWRDSWRSEQRGR